jgi:hypothetical protein
MTKQPAEPFDYILLSAAAKAFNTGNPLLLEDALVFAAGLLLEVEYQAELLSDESRAFIKVVDQSVEIMPYDKPATVH